MDTPVPGTVFFLTAGMISTVVEIEAAEVNGVFFVRDQDDNIYAIAYHTEIRQWQDVRMFDEVDAD